MGFNLAFKVLNVLWKVRKIDQKHFGEIFKFYAEE